MCALDAGRLAVKAEMEKQAAKTVLAYLSTLAPVLHEMTVRVLSPWGCGRGASRQIHQLDLEGLGV